MQLSNKELGEYLEEARKRKKYSTYDVNKLTDISQSYISLLEKGKRKASAVILKTLAPIYNLDYLDLYEKAGYIELIEDEIKNKYKKDEFGNTVVSIPILGIVKAGYDWLAEENVVDYITLKENIPNAKEYYALKITGDSMLPLLSEGDLVIVHDQDDVESGQTAVILINGEEATVKKVVKTNDGVELHSMNPYYPVKKFTFEDMKNIPVKIIGRVKEAKIKGAFE